MVKIKKSSPRWISNLSFLMKACSLNPRALSLKAGLNPTAVRDMLEGRTQSPRYDTVEALASALQVTPAQLMGATQKELEKGSKGELADEDLALLTEIIARLQELVEAHQHKLPPKDFAAMVTTIYRQMTDPSTPSQSKVDLSPRLHDLIAYEALRGRLSKA